MIFLRFIGKKYLAYLAGVSLSLAALYTLVEVLEKLARYREVSVSLLVHYAAIVFIPSFMTLFSISAFLAAILLLREMVLRDYSILMAVYGIHIRRVVVIVGLCSLLAGTGIMVLHEAVGYHLSRRMVQAKVWLFKRGDTPVEEWLRLGASSFIFGLGNNHFYVVRGGAEPSIVVGSRLPDGVKRLTEINFQSETLSQIQGQEIDLAGVDILTYAAAQVPLRRAIRQVQSRYGQQIVADLLYFFLKIVLLPIFAVTCFFLAARYAVARWIYAGLPYVGLGVGYACTQLMGPLLGFSVLFTVAFFLLGYFFAKLK